MAVGVAMMAVRYPNQFNKQNGRQQPALRKIGAVTIAPFEMTIRRGGNVLCKKHRDVETLRWDRAGKRALGEESNRSRQTSLGRMSSSKGVEVRADMSKVVG